MPNAFAHVELNTQDLKKAKKFYQALFDWKLSEAPSGMPYTMIDVGTGTGGGMAMAQDPAVPSAWLPYVLVDDVKKTLAKAAKAGATIKVDYMSIGEMGAIGVFVDPTGATLGIWEEAKGARPASAESAAEPVKTSEATKKKTSKKAAPKAPAKPEAKKASATAKSKAAPAPAKKAPAPSKAKKAPASANTTASKKGSKKRG
jgi:predicted enzyme related to lactoylglutathione lyase